MPTTTRLGDFDPDRDIPSLEGKVILVTGGTAGLGRFTVEALAKHDPAHIYFTGRKQDAADELMANLRKSSPRVPLTFIKMDLADLKAVKRAITAGFAHDRLDILVCNAGIMSSLPGLSKDGYEIQFATNHLGHAMVIKTLLPVLLKTAAQPGSDVRVVTLSSKAWKMYPRPAGIEFASLNTTQDWAFGGSWLRYGQSKLANVVYAAELARRYSQLTSVSLHPGIVATRMVTGLPLSKRLMVTVPNFLIGDKVLDPEKGAFNSLWVAAGAKKGDLANGAYYLPVGIDGSNILDKKAKSVELAGRLWTWTEEALAKAES